MRPFLAMRLRCPLQNKSLTLSGTLERASSMHRQSCVCCRMLSVSLATQNMVMTQCILSLAIT